MTASVHEFFGTFLLHSGLSKYRERSGPLQLYAPFPNPGSIPNSCVDWMTQQMLWQSTLQSTSFLWATNVLLLTASPNLALIDGHESRFDVAALVVVGEKLVLIEAVEVIHAGPEGLLRLLARALQSNSSV
jgi:hypothetical protein